MNQKKAFYIIPEIDETQGSISIDPKDIKSFQRDFEKKKTQLVDKKFFNLPDKDEIKPVFYIKDGERLYLDLHQDFACFMIIV